MRPLISIGIPAFNAQAHIAEALEGLVSQTFGDIEIIVSDNASTDGTCDIVTSYQRQDSRIILHRQKSNIGANPNYSAVARMARGQFFKWSSSSDWCHPTFLDRCLSALQHDQDVVLAVPRARMFENDVGAFTDYEGDMELMSDLPSQRFRDLLFHLRLNNAMNGLIRTSALRNDPVMGTYAGADVVMLGRLALLGKFTLIDERLFYRRMDPASATSLMPSDLVRKHHYPTRTASSLFQGMKRSAGWIGAGMAGSVSFSERLKILNTALRVCWWERARLLEDLRDLRGYIASRRWL